MERSKALALYQKLIATQRGVELKGDRLPYTSVNGHMTSVLDEGGTLALHLSPADNEAFRKKYRTDHPVSYGAVRRDYVVVPDALLSKTAELARHFAASFAYVASLPPKATTRKKPAPKKKPTS